MERMKLNIEEANRALVEKPMLATSAERLLILNEIKSQYRDLPQPLQFSKHLSILLARVSTPIEPYDLIAGRCVDRLLNKEEEQIFAAFVDAPDNPSNYSLMSAGHCTYSWELLATEGLVGLHARAKQRLMEVQTEEERVFLTGALEAYEAIAAYLLRYSEAAAQKGMHELADNLRRAATERPNSFAVALQLLWTVTFINCAYVTKNPTLTVGRLDQILYPFYRADLEKGILTDRKSVV